MMSEAAKQARREYQRKWREQNKEHIKAYNKRWRDENKERVKELQRKHWERKALQEQ